MQEQPDEQNINNKKDQIRPYVCTTLLLSNSSISKKKKNLHQVTSQRAVVCPYDF